MPDHAYGLSVRHNFEAAHRLTSTASRKCQAIHGHSWWAELYLSGDVLDADEMLCPYGDIKKAWRGWIDSRLDHALLLNQEDPLIDLLKSADSAQKIFECRGDPTTENVAKLLFSVAINIIHQVCMDRQVIPRVRRVVLQETHTNFASYGEP
jgi:6-pyruvoyltetrahydropterin/6-carboxytetrahydropterin synthase